MSSLAARRSGFTLVELLVVIAIIGILVGLLMPAVQSARESARRLQCENNLKQLALACTTYNSARKMFPPAATFPPNSNPDTQNNGNVGPSWIVLVLPYMEQENLYNIWNKNASLCDASNMPFRSTELSIVKCPTDAYNRVQYTPRPGSGQNGAHGPNWARGNYGANAGIGMLSPSAHCPWCLGGPTTQGWLDRMQRGVMGINSSCSTAMIRDGMSNTLMIEEIRSGLYAFDPRGTWAFPGAGESAVAAHGNFGDSGGPNTRQTWADDTSACDEATAAAGGDVQLAQLGMGCYPGTGGAPNRQAAPRSMHTGGIYAAFCDGSVKWMSDYIELSNNSSYYSVWDRLNISYDNLPISAAAY